MQALLRLISFVLMVSLIIVATERNEERKTLEKRINPVLVRLTRKRINHRPETSQSIVEDSFEDESQNIEIIQNSSQLEKYNIQNVEEEVLSSNFIEFQPETRSSPLFTLDNFQEAASANYGTIRSSDIGGSRSQGRIQSSGTPGGQRQRSFSGSSQTLSSNAIVPILRDDRTHNYKGEYSFAYESGDGTRRQEFGSQNDGQVVQGGWSYSSPEGIPVEITFVADHNGFQPQGSALPVAPALPYQRSQQFVH